MPKHKVTLFHLLGFPIQVDLSWLFIAVLLSWSLASGVFPAYAEGLSAATYWVMGSAGALGLFACIVLHELGHAVVARRMGVRIRGITLFIFGGVGEMTEEPGNPKAEFLIAIAGGAVSVVLAAVLYGASQLPWTQPVAVVLGYLAVINLVLVGFNLLPAFPLDGGRVLRAALWRWKGNLRWATRVASEVGSGFGAALMVLAVLHLLAGSFVGAVWWFILGLFLRGSARLSYQQLVWRQLLDETSVRRLMNAEPRTVTPDVPIDRFVEDYVYKYHHKMFPVVRDEQLVGCITTAEIKELPREQWRSRTVGDVLKPCSGDNVIGQDADAIAALRTMRRTGQSRLVVADDSHLLGVIALKDLWSYIAQRVELEGDELAPA